MAKLEELKSIYPGALAWQFGDSPELADELVQLVLSGVKTATCSVRERLFSKNMNEAKRPALEATISFLMVPGSRCV